MYHDFEKELWFKVFVIVDSFLWVQKVRVNGTDFSSNDEDKKWIVGILGLKRDGKRNTIGVCWQLLFYLVLYKQKDICVERIE